MLETVWMCWSPPLRLQSCDKGSLEERKLVMILEAFETVIMKTSFLFVCEEQKLHNLRN
jgi:hypothetical protein